MQNPGFQLALLKIPVTEIDRSVAFYRDALDFEEQFVSSEYGWAQLLAGDLPLALYKPGMGGGDGTVGGSLDFHLAMHHERFDGLAKRLQEQGHLVEDTVHQGDDGSTFVDVYDPDGNTLKIMRQSDG